METCHLVLKIFDTRPLEVFSQDSALHLLCLRHTTPKRCASGFLDSFCNVLNLFFPVVHIPPSTIAPGRETLRSPPKSRAARPCFCASSAPSPGQGGTRVAKPREAGAFSVFRLGYRLCLPAGEEFSVFPQPFCAVSPTVRCCF